jgi:TolB-like protein
MHRRGRGPVSRPSLEWPQPVLAPVRRPPLNAPSSPLLYFDPLAISWPVRPMLAVLPFTISGTGPGLQRLSEEVTQRLRESLAADPAIQSILVDSEVLFKAPPHALELICRELRVGHLILGKCHGAGDEPSVYVELTDTRQWHVCWAEFYRGAARTLAAGDAASLSAIVGELRMALLEHSHHH